MKTINELKEEGKWIGQKNMLNIKQKRGNKKNRERKNNSKRRTL